MDTFSALADPTRRHILEMLARRGRLSATEISNKFQMSSPAISQHLKVLRVSKLVKMEKQAQRRIYTINTHSLLELEMWARTMNKLWNERFDRLEAILKKQNKGGE